MDLKILFGLGVYWTLISLVFGFGISDTTITGNFFNTEGYNSTGTINSTGFSSDEIDTGGFFSGIIGIFTAMGRIIGFYTLGLTPALTGSAQIIFSAWQILLSIFTIGFIISAFWDG